MDEIIANVTKLFDALSPSYDAVGVDFFQPIAASLTKSLKPVAGESWLDIGSGRGAVIDQISKAIGSTGKILATDISTGMTNLLAEHIAERKYSNVAIQVDNAQDPRLPVESFDTISSSLVLFFLPDPLLALQRWLPLLKSGGRLGVTTFGVRDPRMEVVQEVLQAFAPPAMKDARVSGQKGPFSSDEGMEDLLRGAGFINVRTVIEQIPIRFTSPDHWYNFSWSVGMRQMWLLVPESEFAAVRAEVEKRLVKLSESDGSIVTYQNVRHTLGKRL